MRQVSVVNHFYLFIYFLFLQGGKDTKRLIACLKLQGDLLTAPEENRVVPISQVNLCSGHQAAVAQSSSPSEISFTLDFPVPMQKCELHCWLLSSSSFLEDFMLFFLEQV